MPASKRMTVACAVLAGGLFIGGVAALARPGQSSGNSDNPGHGHHHGHGGAGRPTVLLDTPVAAVGVWLKAGEWLPSRLPHVPVAPLVGKATAAAEYVARRGIVAAGRAEDAARAVKAEAVQVATQVAAKAVDRAVEAKKAAVATAVATAGTVLATVEQAKEAAGAAAAGAVATAGEAVATVEEKVESVEQVAETTVAEVQAEAAEVAEAAQETVEETVADPPVQADVDLSVGVTVDGGASVGVSL